MSTFDNPFDSSRPLNSSGCACGRHVNQAEHERDAARQLQCAPVESEDKRYQHVVASAVIWVPVGVVWVTVSGERPTWTWLGVAAVAGLLAYEHSLVGPGDLRRLDTAFFTMNGVISVTFFVFVLLDVL